MPVQCVVQQVEQDWKEKELVPGGDSFRAAFAVVVGRNAESFGRVAGVDCDSSSVCVARMCMRGLHYSLESPPVAKVLGVYLDIDLLEGDQTRVLIRACRRTWA